MKIQGESDMEAAAIRLENVSFGYHGSQVLREINFSVQKGEHIGIVGTSGCGKSTLLKLISGLYRVQQGKLMVEGETEADQIRTRVSVVMQNPGLFPATVRENISCGHEMSEDKIRSACEAARLTEWLKTMPEGLDTFVGERGLGVPGGQAQRIAIARAIARDARFFCWMRQPRHWTGIHPGICFLIWRKSREEKPWFM